MKKVKAEKDPPTRITFECPWLIGLTGGNSTKTIFDTDIYSKFQIINLCMFYTKSFDLLHS